MGFHNSPSHHQYYKSEDSLRKPITVALEEGPLEIALEENFNEEPFPEITYSIMPVLEQIESHPPEKYSEKHLAEIRELLARQAEKIRVVTYNILFDLFDHKLKDPIYSWASRLPKVVQSVENMQPDILCLQETYLNQIEDLQKFLGDRYNYFVGAGATGEVNAVFYNKERFEIDLENYGDELTNATLAMPLNPKDEKQLAKIPNLLPPETEPGRQLTLVHFLDRITGKKFAVVNTHLTYFRLNAREDQAHFIAEIVQKLHALNTPVIFTGDLNTFSNVSEREFSFLDGTRVCQIFERVLKDTRNVALLGRLGPAATGLRAFTDRDGQGPFGMDENPDVILDHIFVSPEVLVIINATETALVEGHFPSDHLPVIADIVLP